MYLKSHLPHFLFYLGLDTSGTDFLSGTGFVLVRIVIKADFGNDLHRRKGLTAEDAAGKFPSIDELLRHEGVPE